ncbi:MAG: TetR/AcrR family transcriptional regulator [Bacilli bacterium]|jgi:AcrR family transcriptional regulator|uniref:TetR/AcrR family transcriptional regulator n=1 Tax=unclassified Ureibacillus TaxID=2638520 RepID=UPI001ECF5A02|nr:TetR family transcriptional regulator [Bacilli bacterium]
MNKRKKAVIDHALRLFVEHGIAKTSIQQIIERAGISKGTFYNYFSSKTECIEAILEQARYDASLLRAELMIGKDPTDINVFANQIAVLWKINQESGLDVLYEEILHSGEDELKELVLRHRILEFEWFRLRLIEVYGDEMRNYGFEAAILFYGMFQYLTFTCKISNHHSISLEEIASILLKYLEKIIDMMINEKTAVLNADKINTILSISKKQYRLDISEIKKKLEDLIKENLSSNQKEITMAIIEEFHRESPRTIILNALLKVFIDEFKGSELEQTVKEIASLIWYDVRSKQLRQKKAQKV